MSGNEFFSTASTARARGTYLAHDVLQDLAEIEGFKLGPYNIRGLFEDPKRFGFLISRHKFVAKMLSGQESVLEIGCQEGLGSLVVSKSVKRLVAIDFYRPHIEFCLEAMSKPLPNVEFVGHDIVAGPVPRNFDAAFSMDVIEHIDPTQEAVFLEHVCASLKDRGTFICGSPSLESQAYASETSRVGHINCKSSEDWRRTFLNYFETVFMFGMNDEVVHTGFPGMCHYIIAICVNPRRR